MNKSVARLVLLIPPLGIVTAIVCSYTYLFTGIVLIAEPAVYILCAVFLIVTGLLVPIAASAWDL
jgi:hypothetical protein